MNKLFKAYKVADLIGDKFSYVVAGPPGTGKSTLLGSMAKDKKTLVLATLSREAASWKYREYQDNVDVVPLWESGWAAADAQGSIPKNIKVDGYNRFMQTTDALKLDTDYEVVILDSGTELGELAWHAAMLPHGVVAPAFMESERSRFQPYDTLDTLLDAAVKNIVALTNAETAVKPKFVGISWHVQPPKEDQVEKDGAGGRKTKESADNKGEGTEYEGKVLPMIRGKFRRRLAGQVDAYVFTDILYSYRGRDSIPNYVIQVRPDEERHAKIPGIVSPVKHIPNDFESLLSLIQTGKVAGQETPAVSEASDTARKPSSLRAPR